MQYLGGKKRIAKQLCEFLNNQISFQKYEYYFEPFVGSCAIIENINHPKRYGNDINIYLIELYRSLQRGWVPPKNITEEEYNYIKNNKEENLALTAFAGIGCSYSANWFGGYAKNNTGRNYASNAYNTLLKQLPKIQNVIFTSKDYFECNPKRSLIYCDPPYGGTWQGYSTQKFDTERFWRKMREWSKDNLVFVSEYAAPCDFECVLEIPTRTDIRGRNGKMIPRTEKLFIYTS